MPKDGLDNPWTQTLTLTLATERTDLAATGAKGFWHGHEHEHEHEHV